MPLDPEQILTRSRVYFTSDNGHIMVDTWECESGSSRWEFLERAEVIHVLAGRMSVRRVDGARDPAQGLRRAPSRRLTDVTRPFGDSRQLPVVHAVPFDQHLSTNTSSPTVLGPEAVIPPSAPWTPAPRWTS